MSNLTKLTEKEYDDLITKLKSKSELTDDTLYNYLFSEQEWLNLSGASFTLTDKTCKNMIDIINPDNFKSLHMYNLRNISSDAYKSLFEKFINITSLNIGCARNMDKESFSSLKNLKNIQILVLNGNNFISDEMLIENLPYWPKLTDLSIRCKNLTDKSLIAISNHCQNLQILDIGRCFGFSSCNILIDFFRKCSKINNLNICSLRYIDDKTIYEITKSLDLLSLDIIGCTNISENGLIKCIPNLKNIKYLRLLECSNHLILELSKYCMKLQNIYIPKNADVEEYAICKLLDNCPDLTNIFISQTEDLTNKVLSKILSRHELIELHIDGIIQFVDEMTYEPFMNLDHKLEKLKVLTIKERPEVVNDEGIIHIGKACPNLVVFDIKYAIQLTPNGFINMAKYFTNIKSLNLKLSNVTDDDILVLTEGCKNLVDLILNNCQSLTPMAIEIVLNGFKDIDKLFVSESFNKLPNEYSNKPTKKLHSYITEICMSDNNGIDNEILDYVLECCPKLNRLNISKCPNIKVNETKFSKSLLLIK